MMALWSFLPMAEELLDVVEPGSFMADNDVGGMFFNYVMHEELQKLCGVDVTKYCGDESNRPAEKVWLRWTSPSKSLLVEE